MFLAFEVKHKQEEVERPQCPTVGIPAQSPVTPNEVPVESGSVLRQKNEIEMKYGSSPRHSKLSPDHSLCPPALSPSESARLTPTLERYGATDVLALTEEVPEGFVDEEHIRDKQECVWQKCLQNDLTKPGTFPNLNLRESELAWQALSSDARSQFQRSFSYRENCQQKQTKTLPFFSRSASMRYHGLPDAVKADSSLVVCSPSVVTKTSALSSAEVCRRLLKERTQHSECSLTENHCDQRSENERVCLNAERGKQLPVSNIQLRIQPVPSKVPTDLPLVIQTESLCGVGDTHYSRCQVTRDEQTTRASAFVSSTQCLSRTSIAKHAAVASHQSDCKIKPSSVTSSSDCRQPAARNIGSDYFSSRVTGDAMQETNVKTINCEKVQSKLAQELSQPNASDVDNSVDQAVQQALDQVSKSANAAQFLVGQSQSKDLEQSHHSELKKRFSFCDKSASFISSEPEKLFRSQSVRDKSSSSLRRNADSCFESAEARKVKKPYGRSHPLSKLSNQYLSRDCSRTVKDMTRDQDSA